MATEKRLIDANVPVGFLRNQRVKEPGAFSKGVNKGLSIAISALRNAEITPTVDAVEVVHGHWLYDSGGERYFCSACKEEALSASRNEPVYDYDWEENLRYSHTDTIIEEHLTNYCPNCGAKMDGDGNG